jgi:F1F0 ATPase subunit 2
MMSHELILVLALGAGLLLGLMFFGGLWWTVRSGMTSPHPALWFMGSMVLRTFLALAGFYLVSQGHWERLLACLGGFIVARFAVTWATGTRGACPPAALKGASDAPEPR